MTTEAELPHDVLPPTPDPAAMADLLAGYCLDVQHGQSVLIRSTTLAAPLLLELQRAVLQRSAWPILRVELPGQTRGYYEHAQDWMLDEFPDVTLAEAKKCHAQLGIQAPDDVHALAGVDPRRLARAQIARRPLREWTMKKRWCSTLWPTPAGAAHAGMSLEEFERFVSAAQFLDRPAGAQAAWGELGRFQADLIERLKGARELRIEAPGTDLRLDVRKRTWVNSDGRRNMPSGEVFTGPLETSANGRIRYTIPSSPSGVDVQGVELEFKDGVVVHAQAEVGDDYLQQVLQTDEGARRVGEVGIGTNFGITRPIGAILFDEKIGGTVHVALGRSYPETGGRNESAVHWDMICDLRGGGRLTADGVVIQEDGRFV
ncbi:aminopeptidase [Paraconexibacter antarcticus]|uniref:Aminopeptidase n=2 Tax=Paraconexibacter antarcticus TaxID=2949664 RepID=A0ABY5DRJ1_9ACTN|nr:aminopeptidase [Paraconexibacter antarcticus]UTI64204.1 aminopeptidase [Paraconexibacter antarcticus]